MRMTRLKRFLHVSEFSSERAELSLSLDVIYHLIEDDVFEKYISDLFTSSTMFVVAYSSNYDGTYSTAVHVKHRRFTDWIEKYADQFTQLAHINNEFPYDENDPEGTSLAEFYIFKKS